MKKLYFFKVNGIHLFLALLSVGCSSNSSRGYDSNPTYEETKVSLEETEKQNPVSFLSSNGTYRKNLLGEWVLEGKIVNSATIATYKDVVLVINFYSKTETVLGSERRILYEYYTPRQKKDFKIKIPGYRKAKKIGWNIESASPIN